MKLLFTIDKSIWAKLVRMVCGGTYSTVTETRLDPPMVDKRSQRVVETNWELPK